MPRTRRWFAQSGTTFTNAFATTPLCCPSRASVLTGRYAHNHGVHTNYDPSPLRAASTLPRFLAQAGYSTAIVGKYLNSWNLAKAPPYFDRWAIEDAYAYYDNRFNIDGEQRVVARYLTDFIATKATQFLEDFEERDRRPWFLYVAPLAPHEPFTAEARYADIPITERETNPAMEERDLADKPAFVRSLQVGRNWTYQLPRKQARTLKSVDDLVHDLFTRMRTLGELDDTLALYLSDNGYLWGEHGIVEKRVPYTAAIKIPLLLRQPGRVAAGEVDTRIVANIDIAPTVLDAAGLTRRSRRLDGRSLLAPARRSALLFEYWRDPGIAAIPGWAALRTQRYHYTEYYAADSSTVTFREYYDLRADPWQLENLLADGRPGNDPAIERLSAKLRAARRCNTRACP